TRPVPRAMAMDRTRRGPPVNHGCWVAYTVCAPGRPRSPDDGRRSAVAPPPRGAPRGAATGRSAGRCAQCREGEQLVADVGGHERGRLGVRVVWGRHLNDVEPAEAHAA